MKPIPQPASTFAGRLQRWRKSLGATQLEAAKQLGVPYKTYLNWEQATRVPAPWQQKLLLRSMQSTGSQA